MTNMNKDEKRLMLFDMHNEMNKMVSKLHNHKHNMAQWKFSGDKHKSLQVDTERTFHQRYPLVML